MAKSKFEKTYESLTMSELNMIETKSGMGIGTMADESAPKAALLTAMAWIVKRREVPTFTYEDAGELKQSEVNTILGLDEEKVDEGNG